MGTSNTSDENQRIMEIVYLQCWSKRSWWGNSIQNKKLNNPSTEETPCITNKTLLYRKIYYHNNLAAWSHTISEIASFITQSEMNWIRKNKRIGSCIQICLKVEIIMRIIFFFHLKDTVKVSFVHAKY